ncbi:MAG: 1-acyl-sn-glycerol-3-phosphate acyltransferase [Ruminococcus sp.]|nr:1-acyl-sn-glycerol-3-phosphate acyltransferase [Ruminococcus sp.]
MKTLMGMCRCIYNFDVTGKEKLSKKEQYIFCPNHESHIDGLYLWTALRDFDLSKISCLAKQELTETALSRQALKMLGGIPIDRTGNSAPAMKRAVKVITEKGGLFYLHPEGTRTRNGEMGEFKNGAAMLSIETGVKIVPVYINGACEIYHAGTKLPKLFNWKKFKKYDISVDFGKPILIEGKNEKDITNEIKNQIIAMKNHRRKNNENRD